MLLLALACHLLRAGGEIQATTHLLKPGRAELEKMTSLLLFLTSRVLCFQTLTHAHTQTRTHTHTHARTHARTHTHTHTHTHAERERNTHAGSLSHTNTNTHIGLEKTTQVTHPQTHA